MSMRATPNMNIAADIMEEKNMNWGLRFSLAINGLDTKNRGVLHYIVVSVFPSLSNMIKDILNLSG